MVTDEGEYAALVELDQGRSLGLVFGDDFYSLLVGLPNSDCEQDLRSTMIDLVRTDQHLLGHRRRRFIFIPPKDWIGFLDQPFHAHFHPADLGDHSRLSVPPAIPFLYGMDETRVVESILGPGRHNLVCRDYSTARLNGHLWAVTGALAIDIVTLADTRYIYCAALRGTVSHRDRNLRLLSILADTIEPLPVPAKGAHAIAALWEE